MGLLTNIVVYKVGKSVGKRRGRREARASLPDQRDINCVNYARFCENYGSCDGQVCEYEED